MQLPTWWRQGKVKFASHVKHAGPPKDDGNPANRIILVGIEMSAIMGLHKLIGSIDTSKMGNRLYSKRLSLDLNALRTRELE